MRSRTRKPAQRLLHGEIPHLGTGGLEQEPAEEREPDAREGAEEDDLGEPERDEEVREDPCHRGRRGRRPDEIALCLPEERPEHAPSVERKRGQQIEDEQDEVDEPHVADDGVDRVGKARNDRDENEGDADRQRHERPCDRDSELRPGAREHPPELRHAAEEPERDPFDLHALAAGDERVPELVEEQRPEEEHGGHDRHREVGPVAPPGGRVREDARGERPDDQREDDEPAPVDADLDPRDAAEPEARAHDRPRPGSTGYSRTWMSRRAHISFRTCGQTVTLTSPRWAFRSRSIIVLDWPMPPPIESGMSSAMIALW